MRFEGVKVSKVTELPCPLLQQLYHPTLSNLPCKKIQGHCWLQSWNEGKLVAASTMGEIFPNWQFEKMLWPLLKLPCVLNASASSAQWLSHMSRPSIITPLAGLAKHNRLPSDSSPPLKAALALSHTDTQRAFAGIGEPQIRELLPGAGPDSPPRGGGESFTFLHLQFRKKFLNAQLNLIGNYSACFCICDYIHISLPHFLTRAPLNLWHVKKTKTILHLLFPIGTIFSAVSHCVVLIWRFWRVEWILVGKLPCCVLGPEL